ncbi:MAG: SurA N-terminal domain-containing protein [Thermoanaerobaculia bacterium]
MLKVLRDNLKYLSWILWVVILIFIAFVFVDFGGGLSRGSGTRASAATVGNDKISYADFERQYRQLESQYRQAFGENFTPEIAKQLRLPLQALDRLVDQRLLLNEAAERGLEASDGEVREAIFEIPGMKDSGGGFIGEETYKRFVRANGYTVRDFEESMRRQIVLTKLNAIFSSSLVVSQADVERAYRDQAERAAVRYVVLPATGFQAQATLSPAEVASYFDRHADDFRLPPQRVVNYLLVDTVRMRAKMTFEKTELESYYNSHLADFKQEEQVHARHILLKVDDKRTAEAAQSALATARKRVEAGADFAKLAAELSDDPASKARGGDLGFFGRGRMIKEFEDAAFDAPAGTMVGPIRTSFGYHLIQVLEKRPAGQRPFAEAEAQVRSRLAAERAEAQSEAKANELAAKIAAEKLTTEAQLKALADNDTVIFITTPPFGVDEVVAGIGRGTPFSSSAFALETGKTSTPIKIARGFAILQLASESPARMPALAEVEAKVRPAALRAKAGDLALARLNQARSAMAAGKSLADVAKELAVEVKESGEFGRDGKIEGLADSRKLVEAALAAKVGDAGSPVLTDQGAVLYEVTARKGFDAAAFAAESTQTRETLERNEVNRLLGSIIEQRKREAKVQYDKPLLEQFGMLGDEAKGT